MDVDRVRHARPATALPPLHGFFRTDQASAPHVPAEQLTLRSCARKTLAAKPCRHLRCKARPPFRSQRQKLFYDRTEYAPGELSATVELVAVSRRRRLGN